MVYKSTREAQRRITVQSRRGGKGDEGGRDRIGPHIHTAPHALNLALVEQRVDPVLAQARLSCILKREGGCKLTS